MPFLSSDVQDLPETVFRDLSNTSIHCKRWRLYYFPQQEGFPSCLPFSVITLPEAVHMLSSLQPGSWFYLLHLQMRTPEAQRDIKQLAQDLILTNGVDPRFVLL